jgi:glycosyltransferase involved in cell wall biosynthesis
MPIRTEDSSPGPRLSIGLPVYNGARSLRRTLDLLRQQTFTDFEVLLSDNASTDETAAIGEEYAALDSRVRYVRQPRNLGAIGNFIYVFEQSAGRYFSWMACDDFYETPTHIDLLRAQLDAGAGLAFPNVNLLDLAPDGSITMREHHHLSRFREATTRYDLSRMILRGASHPVYGMFRREVIARHLPYLIADAGWSCFNEGRFVQRVFAEERCAFVADAYLNVCLHPGSVSRRARPHQLLRDFARYTWLAPQIYLEAQFTPEEKIKLLGALGARHAPYLGYLCACVVAERARRAYASVTSSPNPPPPA